MSISIECPQCARKLRTRDEMAGKRLKCPQCATAIPVPAASATPVKPNAPISSKPQHVASRPIQGPTSVPVNMDSRSTVVRPSTFREMPEASPTESLSLSPPSNTNSGDVTADLPPTADRSLPTMESQASVVLRALGYLIDILPTFLAMPFVLIPILGQIMVGVVLCGYWLLRDIQGASLGKLALGCRVASVPTGAANPQKGRILRNLPIAVIPLCFTIPFVGFLLVLFIGPTIIMAEIITLLITGRRLGDMLAGTTVLTNS